MRRRLLNIASTASLLLCMIAAMFWVRSYVVYEGGAVAGKDSLHYVYHYRGVVRYKRIETDPAPWWHGLESHPAPNYLDPLTGEWANADEKWSVDWNQSLSYPGRSHFVWQHLGIVIGWGTHLGYIGAPFPTVVVQIPDWLLLSCLAVPSVELWRRRIRRRLRAKARLCVSCGYNLTGNLSGKCPECGQPIPQKTEATA
jgi:hypothetical protein